MRMLTCATVISILGFASAAQAIDVFTSGSLTSSNYSPSGSNLGTSGYWFANFNRTGGANASAPTENAVNGLPAYVTQTFGATIDSAGGWGGYADLTLPNGTVGNSGALEMNNAPGNVAGKVEEYMTLTLGAGAPNKLRLGVVIDNSDGLGFSNREIRVNGVSTGTLTNNLVPDVRFFDVINAVPGNTLKIEGVSSSASVSHLGGILLDPLVTLDIQVNRTTGRVTLIPDGVTNLNVNGYSITSAAGSLNPGPWSGLQATGLGNGNPTDGIGWEKLGNGLATKVGEFNLTGSNIFGPGGTGNISIGNAFTPGATEDLRFQFTKSDGTLVNGAVTYVTGTTLNGDYNNDGKVDGADYVTWRKTNINGPAGYTTWRTNFGATGGSGSVLGGEAAVPEPTGSVLVALAAFAAVGSRGFSRKSSQLSALPCIAIACLVSWSLSAQDASAARTVDREYRLGETPGEGAVQNQQLGSGNGFGTTFDHIGTSGAGDYQDLTPAGTVTYANVALRPFANGSTLGATFAGGHLIGLQSSGFGGVGYPGATPSPNPNPAVNYTGITTRGMQLWVLPTTSGVRQEIINDTYQFGIHISATNTWGMTWGANAAADTVGRTISSTAPVVANQWTHVQQHSFGNTRGVLYVNGVAVASSAAGQIYQTAGAGLRDITVGANVTTLADKFTGTLDDIEIYVAGSNAATNFGTFNLGVDNEYIALKGIANGDLTNDGIVNDADVTVFLANWRHEQLLGGVRTGDLTSRGWGDFDYDGFVGLRDWQVIRDTHVNGSSLNLGELLGAVPEPATGLMLAAGVIALSLVRTRQPLFRKAGPLGCLAFGLAVLMQGNVFAANLWNVDFQGDTNTNGLFGQDSVAKNFGPDPVSGVWNQFVVPALNTNPQTTFATNPTLNLVNNDGAAGAVQLTLNGQYAGWGGSAGAHPLFGDYIILLGNGTLGFPAPPLNMAVTGLTPGVDYGLRVITGNVSTVRDLAVTVDNDGDGSLTNNASTVAPSGGVGTEFSFKASGTGGLIAQMNINSSVEGNLAGIQIKVGDFNPILTVNRQTGQMTLTNNTNAPLKIAAYTIESNTAGALNPANWLSITDNYDATSPTPNVDPTKSWFKFNSAADRNNLSEGQDVSGSGANFIDDQVINLGAAWIRSPQQDVSMQILLDDGTLQNATVRYTGLAPLLGDLDFDRDIDLQDWALLKTGFSTNLANLSLAEKYNLGDLTLSGNIDLQDVTAFAAAFDAFSGSGAFAAVIGSVPEPGTGLMVCCLAMAMAGVNRAGRARSRVGY